MAIIIGDIHGDIEKARAFHAYTVEGTAWPGDGTAYPGNGAVYPDFRTC